MNILITGSNGFIGSYLKRNFTKNGDKVVTIGLSEANDIKIDLSKTHYLLNGDFDLIIHCAGIVHSKAHSNSIDNNLLNQDVSITINFLKSISNITYKKFIYLSSVSVFGLEFGDNIPNSYDINPKSGYAIAKIISENIIKKSIIEKQLLILRLPLVNGPNSKGNIKKLNDYINCGLMIVFKNNKAKKSILEINDLFNFILNASTEITGTHLIKSYDIYFNSFVESISKHQNKKLIYFPLFILDVSIFLAKTFRFKKISSILNKINYNLTFKSSFEIKNI